MAALWGRGGLRFGIAFAGFFEIGFLVILVARFFGLFLAALVALLCVVDAT